MNSRIWRFFSEYSRVCTNLGSLLSISLQLEGTTEAGVDARKVPKPFKLPHAALKKYLLPCVSSIVQLGFDISNSSRSPVRGEKFALVDHCTLNFVVIEESLEVGSCNLIQTDDNAVISTATKDGGSGGLAWAKPSTKRFNVLARLPHAMACFSVSPPAQPATQLTLENV